MARTTAYLDGVRGLAAFLVFVHHYLPAFDFGAHHHGFGEDGKYFFIAGFPFLRILFGGGDAAVAIFFVLSGFVLPQSSLKSIQTDTPVKRALLSSIVRRPIRLYLPTLTIGFLTACAMHLPNGPYHMTTSEPKTTLLAELWNFTIVSIKYFHPFQTHNNAGWYQYGLQFWTIPVELVGSMLVYGIVFACSLVPKYMKWVMITNSIIFIVLLMIGQWSMGCFVAGLVLSYCHTVFPEMTNKTRKRCSMAVFSTVFLVGFWLLCEPNFFNHPECASKTPGWMTLHRLIPAVYDRSMYYRFWHTIGAVLFIASVLGLGWLQKFFSTRPLQYLGRISFMLYLIHMVMLKSVGEVVRCTIGGCSLPVDKKIPWYQNKLRLPDLGPPGFSIKWLVAITTMTAICVPLAHLATILIDDTSVQLSKKLTQKLGLDKHREVVSDDIALEQAQPLLDEEAEIGTTKE